MIKVANFFLELLNFHLHFSARVRRFHDLRWQMFIHHEPMLFAVELS
jgi:hypothetical protein